ncbi:glycosyltransferase family A protein [Xanthomonas campestris]|uniref:glycosyltransferase family A protein n=1 Tax=Xanthomonas campestris TaxID=339 RepID=UPI0023658E29|nr:glycosyltransferase family 2 protein [Xanthomonas campestris]WDJ07101.1 glycosyltransferase [Xanthomonas campestris pv. incanae]
MSGQVDHAFVVPAYGDSPYLDACLRSLAAQSSPSPIWISTSTPSPQIELLAARYGARLVVHHQAQRGIGHDWNLALGATSARWVTLAHQDDVYLPDFAGETKAAIAQEPGAVLVMTGYGELAGEQQRVMTPMLAVKRVLQEIAFLGTGMIRSRASKRRLLMFGCAVPCPSVTVRKDAGWGVFREDLRLNLDWDAWTRAADQQGPFVRVRRVAMLHRVHAASTTSDGVLSGMRATEDLMMFQRFWPLAVAALLARVYRLSYSTGG